MIYLPIICFALAAVLGITILMKWLQSQEASSTVIYSHGGVAAVGLVFLIVYAIQNPSNFPQLSLVLLIITALGGFVLFGADKFAKKRILPLGIVHALLAVGGFLTLLFFVFA